MKVGVRSGGHSWAGNHVRDGGHAARRLAPATRSTIDARGDDGHASGPAAAATSCSRRSAEQDLFFPAGHCPGVGARRLPAAGRLRLERPRPRPGLHERRGDRRRHRRRRAGPRRRASSNADLLWAARGVGPRVLRRRSRASTCACTPRPQVVANGVFLYPIDVLEEVFRWAHEIGPRVPRDDGADADRPPRRARASSRSR